MNYRPGLVTSVGLLTLTSGLSVWAWTRLPSAGRFPVHWSISGAADRYGSRLEVVALLPAVMLALLLLFMVLPKIEPRRLHLERSAVPYTVVWIAVMALLTLLQLAIIFGALGRPINITLVAPLAVGALFILIGLVLGRVQSNFMFGIRTPWTLASERSWRETHRVGGPAFALFGLALIATGLTASSQVAFWTLLAGVLVIVIGLSAYSYFVWRADVSPQLPHKVGR